MSVKTEKLDKIQPKGVGGRFFEAGTALNRVLREAPYLSRCSFDKTATQVKPRNYALRYPYMQVNRPGMVSWLIFDLDHANSLIWDDVGLPAPNLIVRNRESGHSHLYYAIEAVCTSDDARPKPIQYMRAIYSAMATLLKADPRYASGPVAKTPGHPWWDTQELHNHTHDLGELAEYVDLPKALPWSKGPQLENASHSRHCTLFEQLRFYAYSIVTAEREKGSYESFRLYLEAFAHNQNNFYRRGFTSNLPWSSLKATVKSVARWTWDKYYGSSRCHRGAMGLDSSLPLAERQRLAAKRTHDLRHKATESKIRAACRQLKAKGEKLTQAAVAASARITRQTVAAHKHILVEVLNQAPAAVALVGAAFRLLGVNYGEHQVSALHGPAVDPSFDGPTGDSS